MIRSYVFAAALLAMTMVAASAHAEDCSSCDEVYSLEETIAKSELVLLAESDPFTSFRPEGPASIKANVLQVLKGNYPDKTIELRSWFDTCPYGFVFQHKQEVIFIVKNLADEYVRYKDGCGAENLKYENGLVDGKYTLEEFKQKFIK